MFFNNSFLFCSKNSVLKILNTRFISTLVRPLKLNNCANTKNTLKNVLLINSISRFNTIHIFPKRCLVTKSNKELNKRFRTTTLYIISAGVFMIGATYAGVPLYRMYCQRSGVGGEVQREAASEKLEQMKHVENRQIRVRFNADTGSSMQWNFRPQQTEIKVKPGETALAFYRARNPTDQPIVGISTYNVVPFEAGPYFNKIQCFCFEEQRLNAHEEVDMPVFFYIDPAYCKDPQLEFINEITLSYTFFQASPHLSLTPPSYALPHQSNPS